MRFSPHLLAVFSACCGWVSLAAQPPAPGEEEFFETHIRPLLADHCWQCHGADKQWNELRLDSAPAIARGGASGQLIVPGQPDQSLLFQAVLRTGDFEMPPDGPLSDLQIEALRHWIAIGAPWPPADQPSTQSVESWKSHWAFQPLPTVQPPDVADNGWCRNSIDQFVWRQLHQHGLRPAAEADRRTLIRRLTYSLTGLPPRYDEVEAFVADPLPDAYERLVDRLLESPRYGEHLARMWLDVARYSDTKGYVYGREERFFVHAAAYRDWVIAALNRDLPYDQFLKLQLAADQCAAEDPSALVAMGLLTLGRRFLGVTHDIIDDRIDVVGRGMMGLTIACARCHDHKYDPIPTADYYALYGVFQNSTDRQVDLSEYLSPGQEEAAFQQELQARQEKLRERMMASRREAADRVRARLADYLLAQTQLHKYPEEGFDIILAKSDIMPAFVRRWQAYLAARSGEVDPVFGAWFRFAALEPESFAAQSEGVAAEIVSSQWVHPWVADLFATAPASLAEVADRYGQLFARVDQQWQEPSSGDPGGESQLGDLDQRLAEPLLAVLHGPQAPCEVPDEEIVSTDLFFDTATCEALWKLQGEVDRWRLGSDRAPAVAVAVFDRPTLVQSRIFRRGNPANKGPLVDRHFLSLFSEQPPEPFTRGSGRLELAERIIDPSNPLTPRVWVNRLWQHHLGTGLVRTPSDFGLRAEPPSHPELLDWLAVRLIESGWSSKAIQRMILTSATFRQASRIGTDPTAAPDEMSVAQELDPDNRLLWRMTPRRLRFEELRDSLLAVSGDLEHALGGKPGELFAGDDSNRRRTIYGLIDRQFLPGTLRVFDFANPDLHIGNRSETLVPQQALYFLNDPFVARRASSLADRLGATDEARPELQYDRRFIAGLYRAVLQREPRAEELWAAEQFLSNDDSPANDQPPPQVMAWSYGYGEVDESSGRLKSFTAMPYFSGSAWQGGAAYPDGPLGWVQLTAIGGHPGNTLQHASIRRWTAPQAATIAIESMARHEPDVSDGVRFRILSSRHGLLATAELKAAEAPLSMDALEVQAGDTIDFVVDILSELNSDQYLWSPIIRQVAVHSAGQSSTAPGTESAMDSWDAARDFHGPSPPRLSPQQRLAQVLLLTNEFSFID